ncbi:hypothetical protein [Kitasatospora sp. NPDC094011]|uniref:hypothetical protein n=1 Tax=Kitasatospora sp. NPDC094011 TaxID=3364090 RepID=UPI0037F4D2EA
MRVTFGLLGPLTVAADAVPQSLPRATVLRGLLGALLLAEGERLPVGRLLDLVWAGQADRIGRGAVHTGMSRLRTWLGQFEDEDLVLESDAQGYRLATGPDAVDLGRFRALLAADDLVADDLVAALALRRGPVLAGLERVNREDPLVTAVEAEVRAAALALAGTALAGTARTAAVPRDALPALTALAEEHPFDEPVHAALLELLRAPPRRGAPPPTAPRAHRGAPGRPDGLVRHRAARPERVARQAAALRMLPAAWDLAACQEKYCDVRGLYDDWRTTHLTVLQACRTAGDVRGTAVLTRGLIEVTTWTTPTDGGAQTMVALEDRAQHLLRLFQQVGEPRGRADALVLVAWSLVAQGRDREALETAHQALDLATSTDHPGGRARAHQIIAVAHGETDLDRTIEHLTETLRLARMIGNTRFEATAIQFLGAAHGRAGHPEQAYELLTRSLAMARSLRDSYVEAFSLLYLATLHAATGDPRARPTAEAALAIARRLDLGHHLAQALGILGEIDLAAGDHTSAVAHLEESVLVWRARGWRSFLAAALRTLARAYRAAGLPDSAARVLAEARDLGPDTGGGAGDGVGGRPTNGRPTNGGGDPQAHED